MIAVERDRIVEIFSQRIRDQGFLRLQHVPRVFEDENLDKALYATTGPKRWIQENFPEFQVDANNNTVIFASSLVPASATADAFFPQDATNGSLRDTLDVSLRDIGFRFAYLPQPRQRRGEQMLRQLQELTEDPTLQAETWRNICAQKIATYLLALDDPILDDSGAQKPRIALRLGIRTPKDQNVYAVLIPNTCDIQPWQIAGFCYPGQQDPSGYGEWLCQTFGLPSEDQVPVQTNYTQPCQHPREPEKLRFELRDSLEAISAALERGEALPKDALRRMIDYQNKWDSLHQCGESSMISVSRDQETLAGISSAPDGGMCSVSPTAERFSMSNAELLHGLAYEPRSIIGAILSKFARPDSLERAIMLGQIDEARRLLTDPNSREELGLDERNAQIILGKLKQSGFSRGKDKMKGKISLYDAGKRLMLSVGTRHGQAERCFMVGLALREAQCAGKLFEFYKKDLTLVSPMCDVFTRINGANAGVSNHKALRIIAELAVLSGQEDVILTCPGTRDSLLGQNQNHRLGFVLALLLLQAGKTEKVPPLLKSLADLPDNGKTYPALIAELASKSVEELNEWKQTPVAQAMIKVILPDGNSPNGLSVRALIREHILQGNCDVGISAIEKLLENNENDVFLYVALFILCKQDCQKHIPQIYRALKGIYDNYSTGEGGEQSHLYTRTRVEIFHFLMTTRAVMENRRLDVPEQDQSITEFVRKAGTRSQVGSKHLNDFVKNNTDWFKEVKEKFSRHAGADPELWVEAFMGSVTGNWTPFLRDAYKRKDETTYFYFEATQDQKTVEDKKVYSAWGLRRCVLQVAKELPPQERSAFLEWIKANAQGGNSRFGKLYAAYKFASPFVSSCNLDEINDHMLELPWEEHFICVGEMKDINKDENGSCYHWLRKELEAAPLPTVEAYLYIFANIAQDPLRAQVLYKYANELFDQGEYSLAEVYYNVLYNSREKTFDNVPLDQSLYPEAFWKCKDKEDVERKKLEYRAHYLSRSRICAAFAGRQAALEGLERDHYYDMLNTLLHSKQAGELHRLIQCFDANGRQLAEDILPELQNVEGSVKPEIYGAYREPPAAAEGLAHQQSQNEGKKTVEDTQKYSAPVPAQTEASPELAAQDERNNETVISAPASSPTASASALPSFARELQDQLSGQELPPLQKLKADYTQCSHNDYERRAELAGQIYYQVSMDKSSDPLKALIRYGLHYYDYHYDLASRNDPNGSSPDSRTEEDTALKAALELARYCQDNPNACEAKPFYDEFTEKSAVILQNWLQSRRSIDVLIDNYLLNEQDFAALIDLVKPNPIPGKPVPPPHAIISVIQGLSKKYNLNGSKLSNADQYRSAYSAAINTLNNIECKKKYFNWLSVRASLLEKLQAAHSALDQRPYFSVTVLNHEMRGMQEDAIFGELQNTGLKTAENIELQAMFDDGEKKWAGLTYIHPSLLPGEKVAFALNYEIEKKDVQSLQYTLTITYSHAGASLSCEPVTGELTIVPERKLKFKTRQYATGSAVDFYVDENGAVVGKGFFGRKQQMSNLREAVEDKPFAEFDNILVQGIRRSGKTSLLNYLKTYVNAFCPDAIPVYVDAQNCSEEHPIQDVFIKQVLEAEGFKLYATTKPDEWKRSWQQFAEEWALPQDGPDRNPSDLKYFYLSLGRIINTIPGQSPEQGTPQKGVLLIFDEFDTVLEKTWNNHQNALLPCLRAITQDSDCHRAVHFVLCGSSSLINYSQEGKKYYQTFQDFTLQIKVDELHQEDFEEMLLAPFKDTSEVILPKETLEWVYRYTGGLVWQSKLLGNGMLGEAKRNHRSVVYPSDVCVAVESMLDPICCGQLVDGCGDMEKNMLKALASLSRRYQSYVPLDELKKKLAAERPTNEQLARSLRRLTDLKLIEKGSDSAGQDCYRFKLEICRRYFRAYLLLPEDKGADVLDHMDAPVSKKIDLGDFL